MKKHGRGLGRARVLPLFGFFVSFIPSVSVCPSSTLSPFPSFSSSLSQEMANSRVDMTLGMCVYYYIYRGRGPCVLHTFKICFLFR